MIESIRPKAPYLADPGGYQKSDRSKQPPFRNKKKPPGWGACDGLWHSSLVQEHQIGSIRKLEGDEYDGADGRIELYSYWFDNITGLKEIQEKSEINFSMVNIGRWRCYLKNMIKPKPITNKMNSTP
jgi:hypothetical protein